MFSLFSFIFGSFFLRKNDHMQVIYAISGERWYTNFDVKINYFPQVRIFGSETGIF